MLMGGGGGGGGCFVAVLKPRSRRKPYSEGGMQATQNAAEEDFGYCTFCLLGWWSFNDSLTIEHRQLSKKTPSDQKPPSLRATRQQEAPPKEIARVFRLGTPLQHFLLTLFDCRKHLPGLTGPRPGESLIHTISARCYLVLASSTSPWYDEHRTHQPGLLRRGQGIRAQQTHSRRQ